MVPLERAPRIVGHKTNRPLSQRFAVDRDMAVRSGRCGGRPQRGAVRRIFFHKTMAGYGLDESKTVLVGFSQGTMMALHVGLRRAKQLAGIVGFSGMLAAPDALGAEIKSRPPVLLLHGDSDEMLPHHSPNAPPRCCASTA